MWKKGMGRSAARGLGLAALLVSSGAAADELALRRIMLSTGGVGYFEYEAKVQGDATLALDVPLDQVSDVLKSIVVLDDTGRVGEVSLPGREPLAEITRGMPFTLDDLASPAQLLGKLRGAQVRVTVAGGTLEGRIISVNKEAIPGPGTATRHRLTVLSASGLRQVILEDATGVELLDSQLRDQVERALAAVATRGADAQRTLSIHVAGRGERAVRVGYVIGAPLWKATYRLVLPGAAGPGKARLQGWAVLENMSGKNWNGVDLSVASGNPVTFEQALYEAYYVKRPEVPVDVLRRILPGADTGATETAPAPRARAHERAFGPSWGVRESEAMGGEVAAPEIEVTAAADAAQVVFRFAQPIDLESGQSMIAPIVDEQASIERVSLYQPKTDKTHPLASVRLVNDTGTALPPGSLSLYEATAPGAPLDFVGDARLAPLPAGEDRMLSYALDLAVRVDRQERSDTLIQASITGGVMMVTRIERRKTHFVISGPESEARVVILEEPRVAGFEPAAGSKPDAITPDHYRFRIELPAGGQPMNKDVVLERPVFEEIKLVSISDEDLAAFISAGSTLPDAMKRALTRVAELRTVVATHENVLKGLEHERQQVVADQARLRENLKAVPANSELGARYLRELGATEDRLSQLASRIDEASRAVQAARNELAAYLRSLTLS